MTILHNLAPSDCAIMPLMVDVAQLLAQPDLALEPRHLPKPDAEVRWVATSELEDPAPFLEGGELLLTTGLATKGWRRQWHGYVGRLAEAGVVALALGVGLTHERVPAGLRRACEEHDLNLIEVPQATTFVAVSRAAARLIQSRDDVESRLAMEAQRRLTAAAMRTEPSVGVADELGRASRRRHLPARARRPGDPGTPGAAAGAGGRRPGSRGPGADPAARAPRGVDLRRRAGHHAGGADRAAGPARRLPRRGDGRAGVRHPPQHGDDRRRRPRPGGRAGALRSRGRATGAAQGPRAVGARRDGGCLIAARGGRRPADPEPTSGAARGRPVRRTRGRPGVAGGVRAPRRTRRRRALGGLLPPAR